MATIYNNIDRVADIPKLGVKVTIDLVWEKSASPVAYQAGTETMIQGPVGTNTDAAGYWSKTSLVPNDEITPADSLYKITEEKQNQEDYTYFISIPTGATPVYWVGDLLVTEVPSWAV